MLGVLGSRWEEKTHQFLLSTVRLATHYGTGRHFGEVAHIFNRF
jgi:hypothetical protein